MNKLIAKGYAEEDNGAAEQRIVVTGRRDLRGADDWAQSELCRVAAKLRSEHSVFVTGMALGADMMWAEIALDLGVPFDAYVPFVGQDARWPVAQRARYESLLSQARSCIVVWPRYDRQAFARRNQAMVDVADVLVAVWDRERSGGTFDAVKRFARRAPESSVVVVDFAALTTSMAKASRLAPGS